jgi:hypothetical protein
MSVSPVILKKENMKIPDYYTVTFIPINGAEPIEYKVAEHSYLKSPRRFLMNNQGQVLANENGQPIVVEWESLRAIELTLYGQGNRKRIVIGLEQGTFEFGHDFDVFNELKKEVRNKKHLKPVQNPENKTEK